MRVFVAVPLPEAVKAAIRSYQQVYRHKQVYFVPEDNLHLTLHFIGEVPDESLPLLREELSRVAAGHGPFTLTFLETSPGPKVSSPRLIWTRFEAHPAFATLSTALCQALGAAPGAYGKFIPHITIARLRKYRDSVPDLPVLRDPVIPNLEVHAFALWHSTLGSPHPVYRLLDAFQLISGLQAGITPEG